MTAKWLLITVSCTSLTACATFLSVGEVGTDDASPGGMVVNDRTSYKVEVTAPQFFTATGPKEPLRGVDHDQLLSVGVIRMPFASGELGLKLTEAQTLKEVTLSSDPGATRALDAAKAALAADTDIRKLKATTPPSSATPTP